MTPDVQAKALLQGLLAVTGGKGGGSAAFAQGGGPVPDDVPGVISRIWDVLGSSV